MRNGKQPMLEISAKEAAAKNAPDTPLIDIRTAVELQAGTPAGALPTRTEDLLAQCRSPDGGKYKSGFVMCVEGIRSLRLVKQLHAKGFTGFSSVEGGFLAWQAAGLPIRSPAIQGEEQAQRYARHLVMPQVGPHGQGKLLDSSVLLAGLGGLNSPAALYLAAAGVGRLGLLDDDRVERSNLQRQIIHGEASLGAGKPLSASQRIADLNPDVATVIIQRRLNEDNAEELLQGWDLVIDGTDNFPARYALNDACNRLSIPLVYGAVMRFQGQVSVFDGSPCFRCLMPESPPEQDIPGCSEAGVLGVMPGIVGTLQASEAIKLLLGLGRPLSGRLLMIDALNMEFRETRIRRKPDCPTCGTAL